MSLLKTLVAQFRRPTLTRPQPFRLRPEARGAASSRLEAHEELDTKQGAAAGHLVFTGMCIAISVLLGILTTLLLLLLDGAPNTARSLPGHQTLAWSKLMANIGTAWFRDALVTFDAIFTGLAVALAALSWSGRPCLRMAQPSQLGYRES